MNLKSHAFLPIIVLICGIFLICLGIGEKSDFPDDYVETVGYYIDSTLAEDAYYDPQKHTKDETTYHLTYCFEVDGKKYYTTTDYATAFRPSYGEEIKILYDEENPENAVIGGPAKSDTSLILFGIFFILGSLPFLVIIFGNNMQSTKFDKMLVLMGSIVTVVGYGALAFICGSFSPVGMFKYLDTSFTLPLLIPILMVFVGVFAIIKGTIFYKPQD